MTYTLEVTDVPEDLIELLDRRVRQQAKDRSEYIRDLLTRDLKSRSEAETMTEVLAPLHEAVQLSGCTEEEAIGAFDEALREVRAARRSGLSANSPKLL